MQLHGGFMKLKYINANFAVLVLISLLTGAPALAGTVVLTGTSGNTCSSYANISVDTNGNLMVICNAGPLGQPTPTPTVVPSCTLTASPATINPGASSTLTASCTPAATSYIWTGPGMSGFFTASARGTVSPTGTTPYSVTGVNNVGTGNTDTKTVTVSNYNGGRDTGWVVPRNCTIIPVTWKFNGLDVTTAPKQIMGANRMHAYRLVVPAGMSLTAAATAYAGVNKLMTVSKNACDFISPELATNKCRSVTGKTKNATVDLAQAGSTLTEYCKLPEAGSEVFINIKNATSTSATETCVSGSICTYYVNW